MSVGTRYWRLVRIDATGKRKIPEIPLAKAFFTKVFNSEISEVSDSDIQRQLLQLYRHAANEDRVCAERCLLCFISWILEEACLQLEIKFGENHGFRCEDLLPYVLDDDGTQSNSYQSFSQQILISFDSQQSSLRSWTNIKVKQHPALNQFLLECGVYLISDWAILNDTQPKQIERIFKEFHALTDREIEQAKQLLSSYHAVYRLQRLQHPGIRGKCNPPTTAQLQEIAQKLGNKGNQQKLFATHNLMAQLQKLASQLREYRIYVRGGSVPIKSFDGIAGNDYNSLAEKIPAPNCESLEAEEQVNFLELYRQQFQACFQSALVITTQSRVKKLQRKKEDKAKQFLTALALFHCENMSMKDIASNLGLRAQDAVTKLLKLKEFRADVQQQMLIMLRDYVQNQAEIYADIQRLKMLDAQITAILHEQITQEIAKAEIQSHTAKNLSANSLFAKKLCKYLDTINNEL